MDIKSVIREQRQELENISRKEKIIDREGLKEARVYLKHPNILLITGIRRCGKSIFSYLLEKDSKFAYVNFDDERLRNTKGDELDRVLGAFYEIYGEVEYIILDEIQNISGWELFANRLRRTKKVILTGSNSNLLSGELATHLTGRHIDVRLFPFSFREFLTLNNFPVIEGYTTEEKARLARYLEEYIEKGGLPESYKFGSAIVTAVYEDIISKDIIIRYKINKTEEIKKLAKYLVTNSSGEISYSKLANILGIKHVSTISKWVGYLKESFLIFTLEKFDFKLKQQFIASKKVYCIDTGIIGSIGFKFSEDKGKSIENIAAIELQRRKTHENKLEVYYWKDYQQNEVDFVLKVDRKITALIQSTYANSKEDIKEREINSLIKCSEALKCDNLIVITWDYSSEEKIRGKNIKFIPLWKWLLENY
ncbi:MAG: ATP-binding protein [archaeon]